MRAVAARLGMIAAASVLASACAAVAGIEDLNFIDVGPNGTSPDATTDGAGSDGTSGSDAGLPTFGDGGIVTEGAGSVTRIGATADGKVFALGRAAGASTVLVAYDPNGQPLSGFASNGRVTIGSNIAEIAVLPAANEVLVVTSAGSAPLCNMHGYLVGDGGPSSDTYTPFAEGGVAPPRCTGAVLTSSTGAPLALVVAADGDGGIATGAFMNNGYTANASAVVGALRTYAAAIGSTRAFVGYSPGNSTCLAAFSGYPPTLDPTYGNAGSRCAPNPLDIVGIAALTDNTAIAAANTPPLDGGVAPSASLLVEQGDAGLVATPLAFAASVKAIVRVSDKFFVAGTASSGGAFVARVHTDGGLDPGFGNGGIVTVGTAANDTFNALAATPSNKLFAGGSVGGNWTVAAFNP